MIINEMIKIWKVVVKAYFKVLS